MSNQYSPSWFSTQKDIPSLESPLIYAARIGGLLLGFIFGAMIGRYFLNTMGELFNAMANFMATTIMVIAVCIFAIFILKRSNMIRQFLMFLLAGVILSIILANPYVQEAVGVAMENARFGVGLILFIALVLVLIIYLASRRYQVIRKGDARGYAQARNRSEKMRKR